ncbi:MAG: hypothetical protein ACRDIB_19810 [Ardenticatenaceae bacterium]
MARAALCSHYAVLRAIKRSPAYRGLRPRLAAAGPVQPVESWTDGELIYTVFDLVPQQPGAPFAPLALCVLQLPSYELLLVRLVTPTVEAPCAEVTDLYVTGGINHATGYPQPAPAE